MSRVYAVLAVLLVLVGLSASLWFAHEQAVNAAVKEVRDSERAACKRKTDALQLEIDNLNKAIKTVAAEREVAQAKSAEALAKAKALNKAREARIAELQALILKAASIECSVAVEEVRSELQ